MQGKRKIVRGVTVKCFSVPNQATAPLRLNYPVCTLDKQLLLPENTLISTKIIDTLISSNSKTSYNTYSPFNHGSVKKDIFNSLQEHHYPVIFAEQEKTATSVISLEKRGTPPPHNNYGIMESS